MTFDLGVATGRRRAVRFAVPVLSLCTLLPGLSAADPVDEARQAIARASSRSPAWTGPTTGPSAEPGKTIAVLAEDLRNGGVLGVAVFAVHRHARRPYSSPSAFRVSSSGFPVTGSP